MKKSFIFLMAAVTSLLVGARISPVKAQEVKVGITATMAEVGIYVAQEKGFFKEQGLTIKFERFASLVDQMAPLSSGHLDVGTGALTASLFNAFAREIPLVIVGENVYIPTQQEPHPDISAVVVRQDLVDSGVYKKISDIKGMPVAVVGLQNPSLIYVERTLARGGLKLGDVELIELRPVDIIPAFQRKRIAAAWVIEPFLTIGLQQKLFQVVATGKDYYPGYIANILIYSPRFARKTEEAQRFMEAWLKGQRWYYEAAFKSKNKEELFAILEKYTPLKGELLRRINLVAVNPNGARDLKAWKEIFSQDQEYWVKRGVVPKPVDIDKMIDLSFLQHAIKQLGEYKD